jgi:uncharacterized membrane protein
MLNLAIRYSVTLVVLATGDALWLSFFARSVFRPTLGTILLDGVRWPAAIAFYLLFAAGVMFFATTPAVRQGSWPIALLNGALLGFFGYMTYDLTNLATIKAWTMPLALMDIGWGTLLTALATLAGYATSRL